MEYHSVLKINERSSHGKIQRNLVRILLRERSQSGKATGPHDSSHVTFWERYGWRWERVQRLPRDSGGERGKYVRHGGFLGQRNYCLRHWNGTRASHIVLYLSKPTECTTPRGNPTICCTLYLKRMYQRAPQWHSWRSIGLSILGQVAISAS